MGLSDLYNSIGKGVSKVTKPISSFFNPEPIVYHRSDYYPEEMTSLPPKSRTIKKEKIPEILKYLESSGGTNPNKPTNMVSEYVIPAFNENEKERVIKYNTGYAGDYGLTPAALGQLAKSRPDRNAPIETYTKYGMPLIPGLSSEKIQEMLLTPEGAGELAMMYFLLNKDKDSFSPEDFVENYVNSYVTKKGAEIGGYDFEKNRARALEYLLGLSNDYYE